MDHALDHSQLTAFEKHLVFFADDKGYLTYDSIVTAILKIDSSLKGQIKSRVIAYKILERFGYLGECLPNTFFTSRPVNKMIHISQIIKGKHLASTNVWDSEGNFDQNIFDMICKYLNKDGILTPDNIQTMLDDCAQRDYDTLEKNGHALTPSGCPFSKFLIKDGRDFGNISWSFLDDLIGSKWPLTEETLKQFFTDADVFFQKLANKEI